MKTSYVRFCMTFILISITVLPVLLATNSNTTTYYPPYNVGFSIPYSYVSGVVGGGLGEHNVNLQSGLITAYGVWMGSYGSGAAVIWADQGIGVSNVQVSASSSNYIYVERPAIDQQSLNKSLSFLKHVLKHTSDPGLKNQLLGIEKELLRLSQQKIRIKLTALVTNKAIYLVSSRVKVKVKIYFRVDGRMRTAAGSGVPPFTGAAYSHAKLDLYLYLYNTDTGQTYRRRVTIAEITSQSYSFAPPFDGKDKTFDNELYTLTLEYYVEPGHYNIYGCAYVETDGWLGGVASAGGGFNFYNFDSDSGIWVDAIEVSIG